MYNNTLSYTQRSILYSLLFANLACILFYAIVLVGILKHYKAFGVVYLQFIVVVAFQDLSVLITPIWLYFPDPNTIPIPIILIVAIFYYVSIISELLTHTLIACNRFVAIVYIQHYKSIFTVKFCRLCLLACFAVAFLCIPVTLMPSISSLVNKVVNGVCWLATMLLYTIAGIVSVKRVRKSLTHNRNNGSDFRRELKLLIQAALTTLVMSAVLISQFLPACSSFECNVRSYFIILFYGSSTPLSYLVVDRTLISYLKKLMCRKSNKVATTVSNL
uniref:G-protein coupled receptors family 1 profile domain-containing protein n=1 Tax=Romanomermis culicivorax TaxID=13658 RepID=A0A915I6X3_ROMCU